MRKNEDKYLRNGVSVKEFAEEIGNYYQQCAGNGSGFKKIAEMFMRAPAEPSLTEFEKSILENLDDDYEIIGRNCYALYVGKSNKIKNGLKFEKTRTMPFGNLFKFIEQGEEYKISDLLGDD